MARTILKTGQLVGEPVKDAIGHLVFQREGGTHDVIVQQLDNTKDPDDEDNWRNAWRIRNSDTYVQAIAIIASRGYWYRAKVIDGVSQNEDTEVTCSESNDESRINTENRLLD